LTERPRSNYCEFVSAQWRALADVSDSATLYALITFCGTWRNGTDVVCSI